MNKICLNISILLLAFMLVGCGSNKSVSTSVNTQEQNNQLSKEEQEFKQSGSQNISSEFIVGSPYASDGEWIYYSSEAMIYKMKKDGSQKQILCSIDNSEFKGNTENLNEISAVQLIVSNGYLYFLDGYAGTRVLYKVRTDGTNGKQLTTGHLTGAETLCLTGDWLYYTEGDHGIYKVKTDGTEETEISYDLSWEFGSAKIFDGWIYYINHDFMLSKVRLDGTENTNLNKEASEYIVHNGWIYYYNFRNNGDGVSKIRIDGSGYSKVNETMPSSTLAEYIFAASGDWIYYIDSVSNTNNILYRIKTDGTSKTKLKDDVSKYLYSGNDMIYYEQHGKIFKANLDGSEASVIIDENKLT